MILVQRKQVNDLKFLSVLQFKKRLRCKEPSYVAVVVAREGESDEPTSLAVIEVLKSFDDVMLANLLRNLPPQQNIDHKLELMHGMKPQAKAPYWMAPPKLAKLQK